MKKVLYVLLPQFAEHEMPYLTQPLRSDSFAMKEHPEYENRIVAETMEPVALDSMKESGYVLSAPYYDNTQVLLVKDGSGFTSSADLAGKDVAVQLGTSGEALLNGDLSDLAATFNSVVTCDSFLKCFTELDGGAVDAVFVDLPVATSYAAENDGFVILNENLGAEQYGIAFRSGDAELCAAIEGAVAELVADGTYAEIAEKYPDIVNNLLFLN